MWKKDRDGEKKKTYKQNKNKRQSTSLWNKSHIQCEKFGHFEIRLNNLQKIANNLFFFLALWSWNKNWKSLKNTYVFAHIVLWKHTSDHKKKNVFSWGQVWTLGISLLKFICLSQQPTNNQRYIWFPWTLFWSLHAECWEFRCKGNRIHPLNPVASTRVPNERCSAVSLGDYTPQLSPTKVFPQEGKNLFKIKAQGIKLRVIVVHREVDAV